VRDRATRSLVRIRDWLRKPNPIREGVTIEASPIPADDVFHRNALDRRSKDDCLIAAAISLATSEPATKVLILTNDIGAQLRSGQFDIQSLELPQDLALPPAQDEQQREILRLQRQLEEARARAPDLRVRFADGAEILTTTLPLQQELDEEGAQRAAEEVVARLNQHGSPPPLPTTSGPNQALTRLSAQLVHYTQIPSDEFERFQKELGEYPATYVAYTRHVLAVENRLRRTVTFGIQLSNLGTAVADDIILTLRLPGKLDWSLLSPAQLPAAPRTPTPPRTEIQILAANIRPTVTHTPAAGMYPNESPEVREGRFVPTIAGSQLDWMIDTLHHNSYWQLGRVCAIFPDPNSISNFAITYTIRERNTPRMLEGKLLVAVNVESLAAA
jgi:hypothetical protein